MDDGWSISRLSQRTFGALGMGFNCSPYMHQVLILETAIVEAFFHRLHALASLQYDNYSGQCKHCFCIHAMAASIWN